MSTKDFHNVRIDQLNVIENEFKDKAERIKVNKIKYNLVFFFSIFNKKIYLFFHLFI